jgi:hypothetical protein
VKGENTLSIPENQDQDESYDRLDAYFATDMNMYDI